MLSKPKSCSIPKKNHKKCRQSAITDLQIELFNNGVVSRELLDAVPNPLLVINEQWQVIYANPAVRELIDKSSDKPIRGLSEGEAFHCAHARHNIDEAGKHECCRICQVARVLSLSLNGKAASEDCRLNCELTGTAANLDLRVWATPLTINGVRYSILSMMDISDKFKREMLEKVCFHDLLNTLTNIKAFLGLLQDESLQDQAEICDLLARTTQSSIDEIIAMRMLDQTTNNDLDVRYETIETLSFMDVLRKTLKRHPSSEGKLLTLAESPSRKLDTDPRLLRRILSNMLLNALEASSPGESVTFGCHDENDAICFWVQNNQLIPREIRNQIFNRCISSKGEGRGSGTHSIKILSKLIGGEVNFSSTESEGTVFSLLLKSDKVQ